MKRSIGMLYFWIVEEICINLTNCIILSIDNIPEIQYNLAAIFNSFKSATHTTGLYSWDKMELIVTFKMLDKFHKTLNMLFPILNVWYFKDS